ncbi:MAG: alpha-amylase family glycosyl hydrolase [Chloroflexota bacterium]
MEFHISRAARARYQFDESLFSLNGNVIIANFRTARVFAQKINARRDLIRFPERAVRAGQINAMGLIDEILHYVVALYRQQKNPLAIAEALGWLDDRRGPAPVDLALYRFTDGFPPIAVHRGEVSLAAYVAGESAGTPNRQVTLEELLLLWLANLNPGFSPFRELFDDTELIQATAYRPIMGQIHDFFDTQPRFGPDHQNLIDMLQSPARASPHSLEGQLSYMRDHWGYLLGPYLHRLLSSLDLIEEENKIIFLGDGPGPSVVYEFSGLEAELERFSQDRDWMPRVVLIAKNTHVWLDQLSKEFGRAITRLDQIPDEALDALARRGFTGLWLIGLWERSPASQRIKQMCGNPEAVASAYSVFDYQIASDLGGDAAFQNLRTRSWARGIRLASDMVANHMGIDSRWVIEHPDWFIHADQSPFPSYSFNGPDLSGDQRVGVFLEDHYYSREDAAVVFKRLDRWTGREHYIYHGNDGTRMPWNDTAQINHLRADAREAVIQTILQVARQFSIIRFDAAMTLAKRHYQRLWYPEPGTGGAIPSRAGQGLTRKDLDALMPVEFWREVVDRVAAEAPDTLLLAEAFWLMEGYFVRTLGMHRVYNSAFMNMLRDEDNAKYRAVMKNTLEFDPGIMRRYVNFMNNPDERTAVDQFGKDDKYFGVCTLLATLPGLPMFGHGQIEGLTEKYGMEYRRAYRDEQPDRALVERHEREIFPLLHRRWLFAGVEHFYLYDFFRPDGQVDEDVFAYSNRVGDARALVVYHNKYAETRGWIRASAAYAVKTGQGDEKALRQTNLGDGLGLHLDGQHFCIFRDHATGLEYIRSSQQLSEQGLYVELGAYKYHVFLDLREVRDNDWRHYSQLTADLNGQGVASVDESLREMVLRPVHRAFTSVVNRETFGSLLDARLAGPDEAPTTDLLDDVEGRLVALFHEIRQFTRGSGDEERIAHEVRHELEFVIGPGQPTSPNGSTDASKNGQATTHLRSDLTGDLERRGTLLGWVFTHALGRAADEARFAETSRSWLDEWLLGRIVARVLRELGLDEAAAAGAVATIKVLTARQTWWRGPADHQRPAYRVLKALLEDQDVQQYLRINRYQGILWYNKETYENLLWWLPVVRLVQVGSRRPPRSRPGRETDLWHRVIAELQQAGETSSYQIETLLTTVKG